MHLLGIDNDDILDVDGYRQTEHCLQHSLITIMLMPLNINILSTIKMMMIFFLSL